MKKQFHIFNIIWNKKEIAFSKLLIVRLIAILLFLAISRWLLYVFNSNCFHDLSSLELIKLFFAGFRFDIYTLVLFNIPLIFFYGIPIYFKYNNEIYKKIVDILFIFSNSSAIALNLTDVIYFRFLDKRMTSELFDFFRQTDENQSGLLIQFFIDYWYMILILIVFIFLIIILTRKTKLKTHKKEKKLKFYLIQSSIFVFLIGISAIGMRGGFQLKPIELITAANYTNSKNIPLVLNTPFSIFRSISGSTLKRITYFDDSIIDSLYNPIHTEFNNNRFIDDEGKNYNLVLIILESNGQEMIRYYNKRMEHSLTPFLDSLAEHSLTFNGMSNGRRSREALPSILSGLPSLMKTDYSSSRYASNQLEGIGSFLKRNSYKTAFFHGGNNGTMSFNSTAKGAGFDDYYGRDEYNNEADYDGTWGIWDKKFLQFAVKKINEYQQPFAVTIFTLSSHHPFAIPSDYVAPDIDSLTPFEKTITYTDDALREFFNRFSKFECFDKTLFVITADHVNPEHKYNSYLNSFGAYKVPIIFYAPKLIKAYRANEMAQHIDINLSVLSALNIKDTVFSFGRNLFDSLQKETFINCNNNIYEFSDGEYLIQSDGENIKVIYDIKKDVYLMNNIYKNDDEKWKNLHESLIMRLQQYNNRMINNKLHYKSDKKR